MTAKATVDSVRLEMISGMNISFPISIREQQKIAEFLTELDNLITLHQRRLYKLKIKHFEEILVCNIRNRYKILKSIKEY